MRETLVTLICGTLGTLMAGAVATVTDLHSVPAMLLGGGASLLAIVIGLSLDARRVR